MTLLDPAEVDPRSEVARILSRAVGRLATSAMSRMESEKAWFRELSAQDRAWVGTIVQAGIRGFVHWYRQHGTETAIAGDADSAIVTQVFGAAPRALTGVISLQQTVDLVRLTIDVVEENVDDLVGPDRTTGVHEGVLRYARELAFATAEVYARAAEVRGAWDARLEALVVDAVLRAEADDTVLSRASALGWVGTGDVVVVLGTVPEARGPEDLFEEVRRTARTRGCEALCAVQGEQLVVVLGHVDDPVAAAESLSDHFGPGPVVLGDVAADLPGAHRSATSAMQAFRAARGWPEATRVIAAVALLPERALAGDATARTQMVEMYYQPLAAARSALLETVDAYARRGGSLEGAARDLYVHANTVRYRLGQVTELTGLAPSDPRDAWILATALALGRLADQPSP